MGWEFNSPPRHLYEFFVVCIVDGHRLQAIRSYEGTSAGIASVPLKIKGQLYIFGIFSGGKDRTQ